MIQIYDSKWCYWVCLDITVNISLLFLSLSSFGRDQEGNRRAGSKYMTARDCKPSIMFARFLVGTKSGFVII